MHLPKISGELVLRGSFRFVRVVLSDTKMLFWESAAFFGCVGVGTGGAYVRRRWVEFSFY